MSKTVSTFPGLSYPAAANPTSANDTTWLGKHVGAGPAVALASGAVVPLPLLFWEARALVLHGIADAEAVDGLLLGQRGLRALHVDNGNLFKEAAGSGKTRVDIWAPDYGGTTLGPFKSVLAMIAVQPRADCPKSHAGVPHAWWWWYYGAYPLNHEFKSDVWGVENQLAPVEMTYRGDTKTVRLFENGRIALRLKLGPRDKPGWTIVAGTFESVDDERVIDKRLSAISKGIDERNGTASKARARTGHAPFTFVSVANRKTDDGENDVQMLGAKMSGTRSDGTIPFDESKRDEFYCGASTAVDGYLKDIGFKPVAWTFYSTYNGVVKIYDAKGRATPSERRGDDTLQILVKGLNDLVPIVRKIAGE